MLKKLWRWITGPYCKIHPGENLGLFGCPECYVELSNEFDKRRRDDEHKAKLEDMRLLAKFIAEAIRNTK